MEGPATRVTLTGTASVPTREYDLKGVASLDRERREQLRSAVRGAGPVGRSPDLPEADSLIKRSTVTAPLLDALKDRNTRDAVRSVLERLTGGQKAASPDAAASDPAQAVPGK